jgi:hypothetical protein
MLDRLFLSRLSKKGKIAYWVGQLLLIGIWALYLFGIADYSLEEEGRNMLFLGLIAIVIVWGIVCVIVWKKKDEDCKVLSDENNQ